MPRPPLIAHLAVWSQLLPPVMVAISRSWSVRARVWAALALLASVTGDSAQLLMGRRQLPNLWVGFVSTLVTGLFVVTALAEWQISSRARRFMYLALAAYVAVWGITAVMDDPREFSVLAVPVHSVLVLLLSLWTLISNSLDPRRLPLTRQDWFWACLGLALLYGATSAMQPLLRILMTQGRMDEAESVLTFKAGIQVVAMLLITAGMLCPVPAPSGRSSSPAR